MQRTKQELFWHPTYLIWLCSLIFLSPLLLVQALITKKITPRLPEAEGHCNGLAPSTRDSDETLYLTFLGESTVAGVGVETHTQGLAANTAFHIAKMAPINVHWHAIGENGIRLEATVERLVSQIPERDNQIIIICLGVNDVTGMTSLPQWEQGFNLLLRRLSSLNPAGIVFNGIPPMHEFTALPQPLRFVLGKRAMLMQSVIENHPERNNSFVVFPSVSLTSKEDLARDGYHPSKMGYFKWSGVIAEQLLTSSRLPISSLSLQGKAQYH